MAAAMKALASSKRKDSGVRAPPAAAVSMNRRTISGDRSCVPIPRIMKAARAEIRAPSGRR